MKRVSLVQSPHGYTTDLASVSFFTRLMYVVIRQRAVYWFQSTVVLGYNRRHSFSRLPDSLCFVCHQGQFLLGEWHKGPLVEHFAAASVVQGRNRPARQLYGAKTRPGCFHRIYPCIMGFQAALEC